MHMFSYAYFCTCIWVCVFWGGCATERERERWEVKWPVYGFYFNAFFYAISINQIIPNIYREVIYFQTSNYITAHMAQLFIFTFFLTQYIHSFYSTSQHDASSSNSKCKCQKPIECVSFLFLFDKLQFWLTSLVCVSSCHISSFGDARKETHLLGKLDTFVFCVCLAGHCHLWLLCPLSLKYLLSCLRAHKVFIRKKAAFEYALKSTE